MGHIFTKPPTDKQQLLYLHTDNPRTITVITQFDNGYRIVSSDNDETTIILYQNIKKVTYEGIYNKQYKKYIFNISRTRSGTMVPGRYHRGPRPKIYFF